jgi:hypothetical protein
MNYRSSHDLTHDLLQSELPSDLEVIPGIPRSGLLAATILALHKQTLVVRDDVFTPDSGLSQIGHEVSEVQALSLARAFANQQAQRQVLVEAGLKVGQTTEQETLICLAGVLGPARSSLLALELMAHPANDTAHDFIMREIASILKARRIAVAGSGGILAYYKKNPSQHKTDAFEVRAGEVSRLRPSGFRGKIDFVVDEGEDSGASRPPCNGSLQRESLGLLQRGQPPRQVAPWASRSVPRRARFQPEAPILPVDTRMGCAGYSTRPNGAGSPPARMVCAGAGAVIVAQPPRSNFLTPPLPHPHLENIDLCRKGAA